MQGFAEFLGSCLKEHKLTYKKAAAMSGVDRTMISRYARGERKPQSKKVLLKLARGICTTEEELQEMVRAYERTKYSEDYHVGLDTVKEILNFEITPIKCEDTKVICQNPYSKEMSVLLDSKEEILEALWHMGKDADFLKVRCEVESINYDEALKNFFLNNRKKCRVEHIIELENAEWQFRENKMLCLSSLLPILFENGEYKVFYYYRDVGKEGDTAERMNCVISDKGLVFFDTLLTYGLFSNQNETCAFYNKYFCVLKEKCRNFAESVACFQGLTQNRNCLFENKKTGISFWTGSLSEDVCILDIERKKAVCVKEIGIVQLLHRILHVENGE
ncbi:MAG: helix-turn-helix transcriptional regulator [Lachnospiraceae bacterium]|nr:helix-turn-helix transcriptional regulator [Lachnospiraceae bacterium]